MQSAWNEGLQPTLGDSSVLAFMENSARRIPFTPRLCSSLFGIDVFGLCLDIETRYFALNVILEDISVLWIRLLVLLVPERIRGSRMAMNQSSNTQSPVRFPDSSLWYFPLDSIDPKLAILPAEPPRSLAKGIAIVGFSPQLVECFL
jgi:hypothetical protein